GLRDELRVERLGVVVEQREERGFSGQLAEEREEANGVVVRVVERLLSFFRGLIDADDDRVAAHGCIGRAGGGQGRKRADQRQRAHGLTPVIVNVDDRSPSPATISTTSPGNSSMW